MKCIGNSINGEEFDDYVTSVLSTREKKIISKLNLTINVPQKFAHIFKDSKMISSKIFDLSKSVYSPFW